MQYHTESLLNKGYDVHVIAFPGSAPLDTIASHSRFHFAPVRRTPSWFDVLPRLLFLPLKAVFQFMYLLIMMLMTLPRPEFVLVQIPPAIPTLFICACLRLFCRIRVVLDWHNFAYTIMQLHPRTPSLLISLAKMVEIYGGRCGHQHFCVSQAMQQRLKEWKIQATVVYDRPHRRYRPAPLNETYRLMQRLQKELCTPMHSQDFCAVEASALKDPDSILIKPVQDGSLQKRDTRPAVVVSSTSWTADEDFSILLSALEMYDRRWQELPKTQRDRHPRLLIFITGKGPLKPFYIQKMCAMEWNAVAVRAVWLEAADYPVLLGSADLGISLHTSSSGVDLPMKVVDMFGCALPVCAVDYLAITELVQPNTNGALFSTSRDLCALLWDLLCDFPLCINDVTYRLARMKASLLKNAGSQWADHWEETVWSTLSGGMN